MSIPQTPHKPPDSFSPTWRQLVVVLFLATTLLIGSMVKLGMDHHWRLPATEIVSGLKPEDIKVTLDINTAPWYELVLLPRLGEVKAKAIVAYREKYGNFKSLDELTNVSGMGQSIVDVIRDYVKIGSEAATLTISK
jgi:competence ComEA-like helix-hairpin-helix protein